MKATLTKQRLFATLFVTIAILALTPTLARADQPSQLQTISLDLSGQATAIGSGPSGASTLKLTGNAYANSNKWFIIQNVTGSLQIGSTTIQITGGQGSVKNAGATAIFADTNSGKGQLILIGTMNNNTVTFNSPESQLAGMSYLSLSGTVNGITGNLDTNPANTSTNSTSLTTVPPNNTQAMNSSTTSSPVQPQNTTSVEPANVTSINATLTSSVALSTIPANITQTTNSTTVSSTVQLQNTTSVASGNVTLRSTTEANVTTSTTLNNSTDSTATGSSNIPPNAVQTPSNVTITVTQYVSETVSVSVTQTVANVTVSYTVTSTVANTTVTQGNVTTMTGNVTTTATT